MEYLTTQIELVSPTFESWTVHKIIKYLTLGLLFSLSYHNTTAYFFDPPRRHLIDCSTSTTETVGETRTHDLYEIK